MVNKYPRSEREISLSSSDPSLEDPQLRPWIEYARNNNKIIIDTNDRIPGMKRLNPEQLEILNVYLQASPGGWLETPETRAAVKKYKIQQQQERQKRLEEKRKAVDAWYDEPGQARAVLKYLRELTIWAFDEARGMPPMQSSKRLHE